MTPKKIRIGLTSAMDHDVTLASLRQRCEHVLFAGGTTIASRRSTSNAAAGERLRRMEEKLNLLLAHHGIDYAPHTKERWQRLAESNDRANAAKEYSESRSVPLEEAEDVVSQYLADIWKST